MKTTTRKQQYQSYIEDQDLAMFYHPWFLNAVTESGQWDVSTVSHEDQIIAVWPYFEKKKYGFSYLTTPPLTAYLGPWYELPVDLVKEASILKYHKKILHGLAEGLPRTQLKDTRWSPEMKQWMPLVWKGYEQSTRYTFRLDLSKTEQELWSSITDVQRNAIKKARSLYKSEQTESIETYNVLNDASYKRQKMKTPYSKAFFYKLDQVLQQKKAREIWITTGAKGPEAGVYIAYDKKVAYLMATGRLDHAKAGAVSMALWEAIVSAKKKGCLVFDFEGSMIEGIASFFRSFGGTLTPYHRIMWTRNKYWHAGFKLLNRF